ncbi:hypothetical protein [Sphingomonas rubra]|uniref:DUF2188 domain-containing protein n=1 Tax=Sphingomonas rubra TaxID=634430 RepID=A0A1I5RV98_9SPHN|nr:hypothetical protein [Sphingomonas rubra]SFP62424.1 hypothetical protein SAMN04488241_104152 [Sphingomonas rubra]
MARSNEPPFWLVWSERGGPPMKQHRSAADAEREASRLATENPGVSFVVLQPIARVTKRAVEVERFDLDTVPF